MLASVKRLILEGRVCLTASRGSMGVGVSTMVGDSSGDKLGDRSGL